MLENLFKGVLNLSLYATVVAAAIMLVKLVCGRRLSPNFHYWIWSLFLLKLALPLDIKSVFSIFNLFDRVAGEPLTERIDAVLPPITAGSLAQPAGSPSPELAAGLPAVSPGLLDPWNAAAVLWLAGVVLMLAALVFSYLKTYRIIRASSDGPDRRLAGILLTCRSELDIRRDVPVFVTEMFEIPFIFGFIRPMIILPGRVCSGLPDERLKAVLAHELMHIRRKDYLMNLVRFLIKSVHWFNPVVWLACAWMKNDGERACDSAVVNGYSAEGRGEYARALVEVAAVVGKRAPAPAISAFTERDFKGRVKNVLKERRYSFAAAVVAVIVFVAAGIGLLTGAKGEKRINGEVGTDLITVETEQYQVSIPGDWSVEVLPGSSLSFTREGKAIGGIDVLAFYADQPISQLRPNHSEVIISKGLAGFFTEAFQERIKTAPPAASGDTAVREQIHIYFVLRDGQIAYDLYFDADVVDEQAALSIAKSFTLKQDPSGQQGDEAAVATLVEEFGRKLKLVSLLAPKEVAGRSIQENYGGLVAPALLAEWQKNPQDAPGRMVSSPWPERIEIQDIKRVSESEFEVSGEIIEVTSVEMASGGAAARRPVTLKVEKVEGRWLITEVKLGAYQEASPIVYRNTEYSFSFNLPAGWKGYSIVIDNWEGFTPGGVAAVERGPLVSIRHPQWTSQDPRQDIPIMVFTLAQWNSLQQGEFHIGAAPVGPRELGRNNRYVFALPARYNYAFPTGYEEVEQILEGNPLQAN